MKRFLNGYYISNTVLLLFYVLSRVLLKNNAKLIIPESFLPESLAWNREAQILASVNLVLLIKYIKSPTWELFFSNFFFFYKSSFVILYYFMNIWLMTWYIIFCLIAWILFKMPLFNKHYIHKKIRHEKYRNITYQNDDEMQQLKEKKVNNSEICSSCVQFKQTIWSAAL